MTIVKLQYGFMEVEWTTLTRDLIGRLRNCLADGFDWKAYQASKEVRPVEVTAAPIIETAKQVKPAEAKPGKKAAAAKKRPARKAARATTKATAAVNKTARTKITPPAK